MEFSIAIVDIGAKFCTHVALHKETGVGSNFKDYLSRARNILKNNSGETKRG